MSRYCSTKELNEEGQLWAEYIALDGSWVQGLKDTHELLESFVSQLEAGPGTSVVLHRGLIKVKIIKHTEYYRDSILYTCGLTVAIMTRPNARSSYSYKWYTPVSTTSPMDILMAYTQALSDAMKMAPPVITEAPPVVRVAPVRKEQSAQEWAFKMGTISTMPSTDSTPNWAAISKHRGYEWVASYIRGVYGAEQTLTDCFSLGTYCKVGTPFSHVRYGVSGHIAATPLIDRSNERIAASTPVRSECRMAPMRGMVTSMTSDDL